MERIKELPKVLIDCSLSSIAQYLQSPLIGEDLRIDGFNLCNREIIADSVVSYCAAEKYLPIAIKNEKVKALFVTQSIYGNASESTKRRFSFIISDTPEWSFYRAYIYQIETGVYPAYDDETSLEGVAIGKGTVLEKGVTLGKNVTIGSNTVIKSGTIIGDNVHIGSCSVIGGEGFQLIKDDEGKNHAIPHAGRTYIGNNVVVGDNTTISRSLFEGYTFIGDDTKISSQVHIAHNCIIEGNCVLTVGATLMGSAYIEKGVWMAPNSCVMNRTKVRKDSLVGTMSFIKKDTEERSVMAGIPAKQIR